MSNSQHLWKLIENSNLVGGITISPSNQNNIGTAPELVTPMAGEGKLKKHTKMTIDVRKDFPWTRSPQLARRAAPYIHLHEYDITKNPMLNQVANYLAVGSSKFSQSDIDQVSESLKTISTAGADAVGSLIEGGLALVSGGASLFGNNIVSALATGLKDTVGVVTDEFKTSADEITKMYGENSRASSKRTHLQSYRNLFTTEETGFSYIFPYFSSEKSLMGSFSPIGGDFTGNLPLPGLLKVTGNMASDASTLVNMSKPGYYIEQPQIFNHSGREKSYTFTFPLDNTVDDIQTRKNWQLVYMLTYQNLPNRVTRDLVLPPVIYSGGIPGVWFSPYSYMQTLQVEMLGTRRVRKISFLHAEGGSIQGKVIERDVLVPDAYRITISIAELFGESQNFLFESLIDNLYQTI